MGDRRQAVLHFAGADSPLYIYVHWHGTELPRILAEGLALGRPRWNDEAYLARTLVETIINAAGSPSGTGVGIAPYHQDSEHEDVHVHLGLQTVRIDSDEYPFEGVKWTFEHYIAVHLEEAT